MEAIAVDIPGSSLLEVSRLLEQCGTSSEDIGKKDHISVLNIVTDIHVVIVETHSAMELEKTKGLP